MPAGDEPWERIKDLLPGGEGYVCATSCQICPHRQLSSGADLTGNFQRNFENLISGNNLRPKDCNAGFISDVNARSFHEERYEAKLKQSRDSRALRQAQSQLCGSNLLRGYCVRDQLRTGPNAGLSVAVLWLVLKFSRSLLRSTAECS